MRHRLASLAAAAALAGGSPLAAQTQDVASLTSAVRTAVDRGELLYIYDQAAWHGTDDIQANYPSLLAQAGGYVVTGDQTKTELVFYDKAKTNAVYRATFVGGKLSASGGATEENSRLSPLERQMIVAKGHGYDAFLLADDVGLCAKASPNLTALPPERPGGPIIVYIMTPQTDMQTFPLGGHFSVEVRPDGSTGAVRRYMKTCFDMSRKNLPAGSRPAGFFVTHLLDPTPTEIHVFTSIASNTSIFVATSPQGRMWVVDGNSVRLAETPKK